MNADNANLVRYEQTALKALANYNESHKGAKVTSTSLHSITENYLKWFEPTAPALPHWSRDLGFKSLSGANGLVEYLEKKNYIKKSGPKQFEILSTVYKPGAPPNFRMPTPSRRSSFANTTANNLASLMADVGRDDDDDSIDISADSSQHMYLGDVHHGSLMERAASLKRIMSNGSMSGSQQSQDGSNVPLPPGHVYCPICSNPVHSDAVNSHVDDCLLKQFLKEEQKMAGRAPATPPMSPVRRGRGFKRKRDASGADISSASSSGVPVDPAMIPPPAVRSKTVDLIGEQNQIDSEDSDEDEDHDARFAVSTLRTSLPADRECVICLESFNAGEKMATLHCLCMFHKDCIADWLNHKSSCPNHPDLDLRGSTD
eukprot:TRINITY_DN5224_c0_g1_i1.p1 TRINITY_DN5224_c0_g1~~TRINITY_DN5224_c0_g1_i1.p1  ORF type:complete len:373 (-),score=72.98 TRINITY_DN5224_c0_g1_i1:171-1289(-)